MVKHVVVDDGTSFNVSTYTNAMAPYRMPELVPRTAQLLYGIPQQSKPAALIWLRENHRANLQKKAAKVVEQRKNSSIQFVAPASGKTILVMNH